jgi:oxygen-independent coproporphyrinogen-3 oxidase
VAGIYIHIPFCRQACYYCNFHFSTSLSQKDAVIRSILREIEIKQDFFGDGRQISTIYFGGGTPSILDTAELASILDRIAGTFLLDSETEITLEANPDDLDAGRIAGLKALGVNRLSIGIQSFDDGLLARMNRAHRADDARRCLDLCSSAGFDELNADLIFGIPGLNADQWKEALDMIAAYPVDHLSCYALTVEPATALAHFISKKGWPSPDEADAAVQFLAAHEYLSGLGYDHYEISNYARNGKYARHNTSYWTGAPYLGLGPSAHSHIAGRRSWNLANNAGYARAITNGDPFTETESLSASDRLNEYIMTGLRTKWGIDLARISREFGEGRAQLIRTELNTFDPAHYTLEGNLLRLTTEGWLLSDNICARLFT